MNRWKAILAATLIFATGATSGILVFRASTRAAQRPRDSGMPPGPGENRPDFLARLKRDLSLSEAQSSRIDVFLQEGRKRNRAIWESIQPQMREESKRVRESIQAELNPDQRAKYDEIMKQRSRDRRGPGPDGNRRRSGPMGSTNNPGNPAAASAGQSPRSNSPPSGAASPSPPSPSQPPPPK